jgi:hypothetical protein
MRLRTKSVVREVWEREEQWLSFHRGGFVLDPDNNILGWFRGPRNDDQANHR